MNGRDYPHFNLFKQWGACVSPRLRPVLGDRFVLYGEWLFAKHALDYSRLPHFFMEFDVMEKVSGKFLDTPSRLVMLSGLPIVSVKVIGQGAYDRLEGLTRLAGESSFRDGPMEGLYIKHEEDGEVKGRYKYIRNDFIQKVVDMGDHWLNMPLTPNALAPDADIWRSL